MSRIKRHYELPVCSTDSVTDAKLFFYGKDVTLYFDYHIEGHPKRSGIRFTGTIALRTNCERYATIAANYDRLTEYLDSSWLEELRSQSDRLYRDELLIYRHFGIYLDSAGSFEVLSTDFEILPEESGSWESLQATTTS